VDKRKAEEKTLTVLSKDVHLPIISETQIWKWCLYQFLAVESLIWNFYI